MAFKRLSEVVGQRVDLLTVRATDVSVFQSQMIVRIDENLDVLTTSQERKEHGQSGDHQWFENKLTRIRNVSEIAVFLLANANHPLEVVTGDVCIILVIEGKRYIVSFLRDIWPVGWLSPGGCPRSFKELLDPKTVAAREVGEELIITDSDNNIYSLGLSEEKILKILALYGQRQDFKFREARVQEIKPCIGNVANLLAFYQGEKQISLVDNVNVTLDPATASISVTLYWEIELPVPVSRLRLFDGELLPNGSLLNRPVRLTQRPYFGDEVRAIFCHGINVLETGWLSPAMASRIVDPK